MGYKKFNIYEGVSISPKLLSFGIIIGIAVLSALIAIGSRAGLTANFVSEGSNVPAQHLRYGETVKEPQTPTRDGYTFLGWYKDQNRSRKFDFEKEKLQDDVTLYAGWRKNTVAANNLRMGQQNKRATQKQLLY